MNLFQFFRDSIFDSDGAIGIISRIKPWQINDDMKLVPNTRTVVKCFGYTFRQNVHYLGSLARKSANTSRNGRKQPVFRAARR